MAKILVSACLLNFRTRYDGQAKGNQKIIDLAKNNTLIPICPEQLGGLATPRNPSEIQKDGTVLMKNGLDVSKNYKLGADIALQTAILNKVDYCILKSKSPSCGKGEIYDGSFSGKTIEGNGICAQLLKDNGFVVYSEEEL